MPEVRFDTYYRYEQLSRIADQEGEAVAA